MTQPCLHDYPTPVCFHGNEYLKALNFAKIKRCGKNKWRVQCDYEDCPNSAWPTSGKTQEIALTKWFERFDKQSIYKQMIQAGWTLHNRVWFHQGYNWDGKMVGIEGPKK